MESVDVAVVGGGLVGSAIGYGLARRGLRVAVCDEGDGALRAARANFGLVWLQSKGDGMPAYARWTRRSADAWGGFAAELRERTGIWTEHAQTGGLDISLGEAAFEARRLRVERLHNQAEVYDTRMVGRAEVAALLPGVRLGDEVVGGSFCPHDGHANPLLLLRGLHAGLQALGAAYRPDARVISVVRDGAGFALETAAGRLLAGRVVLAAGHGTAGLAASLGLGAPIVAQRGQIVVTERLAPVLPMPTTHIRQTGDGTLMLGTTQDHPGFDTSVTPAALAGIAANAVRTFPALAGVRLVRAWAGLRVLTPDGHPVYMQSESHPGAFVAICHSGVTLAAVHATALAEAICAGALPAEMADFHPGRFDVPAAA